MANKKGKEKTQETDEVSRQNEETREIIAHQVEISRDLNDELTRTNRIQILTVGVVATAVSVAGPSAFIEPDGPTIFGISPVWFWLLGVVSLGVGTIVWLNVYAASSHIPLSELQLGVNRPYTDCIEDNSGKIEEWENRTEHYQRYSRIGMLFIIFGLLTFLI